jgi:hypothetical protein
VARKGLKMNIDLNKRLKMISRFKIFNNRQKYEENNLGQYIKKNYRTTICEEIDDQKILTICERLQRNCYTILGNRKVYRGNVPYWQIE